MPDRCVFGGNHIKLCDIPTCQYCFDRSFASNTKSRYLIGVDPRTIHKHSHKLMWFACPCGHKFKSTTNIISRNVWCPYCCDPVQKFCDDDDCEMCLANSFASSEFAIYFDDSNKKTARQIALYSRVAYWFKCDCGHKFKMSPIIISRGGWCPYCSIGSHKLCDNDNCETCLAKSFASCEYAIYFDEKKNKVRARDIRRYAGDRYWFRCEDCGASVKLVPCGIKKYAKCRKCAPGRDWKSHPERLRP